MDNDTQTSSPEHYAPMCSEATCNAVMWWTMLLVGVLAIPSLAVLISMMVPAGNEFMRAVVFIVACWGSVWIGMWLMNKSKAQRASSEKATPKG